MNQQIDQYLIDGCGRCSLYQTPKCKVHAWINELHLLRSILLETELVEECKWSMPCYTYNGKNVVMLGAFKDNVFLSFFKGTLLFDKEQLLEAAGPNSKIARLFKFTSVAQIKQYHNQIKVFIQDAIQLEKIGKKVEPNKSNEIKLPIELVEALNQDHKLKEAFAALTPGRQRSYVLHIESAKQEHTRITRVEKCIPLIFTGRGFNEYIK